MICRNSIISFKRLKLNSILKNKRVDCTELFQTMRQIEFPHLIAPFISNFKPLYECKSKCTLC
jgi:hypothetical protein